MTKERLEELIKQGGEVYDRVRDELIKLDKKNCHLVMSYPSKDIDMLEITYKVGKYVYHYDDHYIVNLIDDTNDIERLNWKRKTYAERTERFEPPMWEDIEDKFDFRFAVNNECYKLVVYKTGNLIGIWNTTKKEDIYTALCEHATKENYEKACEIVRDLFKGEK